MLTRNLLLLLLTITTNLTNGQDLKKAWMKALKSCSKTSIIGNESLFFGPSNTIGLGSVWRQTKENGYNPRFELADMINDTNVINKIIKFGEKTSQCVAKKNIAWSTSVGLPFISKIFGGDGIGVDFHHAKNTTITLDNLALDVIKELPFEQAIKNILANDPNNVYVKDILENRERLLVTKAYRLTGLVVKLTYDPKVLEDLKTKYANGATINLGGDKGLKVEFNYSSDTELTIKLPKEVYIAGEFSTISENGTINLNDTKKLHITLKPIKINQNATIGSIENFK